MDVDAVTFVFAVPLVPEMADGLALHNEDDNKGQTVQNQPGNDRPTNVVEFSRDLFREDAEVQQDNRDLRQGNNDLVEVLSDVEGL